MHAKLQRKKIITETRRGLMLDAARSALAELGMDGANIREIAKRAGYTPGAIYSYFDSKEAIFGALLAESLERLAGAMNQAKAVKGQPARSLQVKSMAWFGFYIANPKEMDWLQYLLRDERDLTAANPQWEALKVNLQQLLLPWEASLTALGLTTEDAQREKAALFAQGVGLLMLHRSARLELLPVAAEALFKRCVDQLITRCAPLLNLADVDPGATSAPAPQADMFDLH
jgi:AcrR family transcriptional regulator